MEQPTSCHSPINVYNCNIKHNRKLHITSNAYGSKISDRGGVK